MQVFTDLAPNVATIVAPANPNRQLAVVINYGVNDVFLASVVDTGTVVKGNGGSVAIATTGVVVAIQPGPGIQQVCVYDNDAPSPQTVAGTPSSGGVAVETIDFITLLMPIADGGSFAAGQAVDIKWTLGEHKGITLGSDLKTVRFAQTGRYLLEASLVLSWGAPKSPAVEVDFSWFSPNQITTEPWNVSWYVDGNPSKFFYFTSWRDVVAGEAYTFQIYNNDSMDSVQVGNSTQAALRIAKIGMSGGATT